MHGLEVYLNGALCSSAILGSSGGGTGVHQRSCIITETQCIVAVGDRIVALSLPGLLIRWQTKADEATCFGLHLSPDGLHVIVHGELAISMFTLDGELLWAFCGKDIFTGACEVGGDTITVWDFNGDKYCIDIKTGRRAF
ncbi:hypothetical protein [Leptonema illini]|uniref:Uncharacterized protein n=1 Tax=Leptonema illini DSM 21528 TaxID=929563 RepID=H2CLU2_9LEPT|nr:hypothetical protein [Leptonema illini]EHQ04703.1 hypothetical protein Lepil_4225 [Leptonema illini DSM 21528]